MPDSDYNKYWYRNWGNKHQLFYIEVPCRNDARYLSYELADYFLQYRAYHPKGPKFYESLNERAAEPWFAEEAKKYGGEFNW